MQQCHFFPNPMIKAFIFPPFHLEKAIIFWHYILLDLKNNNLLENNLQNFLYFKPRKQVNKQGNNLWNILHNNLVRTHYKLLGKENSWDKHCVKFQDFSRIFQKN